MTETGRTNHFMVKKLSTQNLYLSRLKEWVHSFAPCTLDAETPVMLRMLMLGNPNARQC